MHATGAGNEIRNAFLYPAGDQFINRSDFALQDIRNSKFLVFGAGLVEGFKVRSSDRRCLR